jgi:hypothetical protein
MLPQIDTYRPQIEAALKFADDSHTFEDIKRDVEAGLLQFWPGFSSVMITEVVQVPRYRSLNIFLAGGQLQELHSMLRELEKFAVQIGADRLTLNGRQGWARSGLISKEGWEQTAVVMQKKI